MEIKLPAVLNEDIVNEYYIAIDPDETTLGEPIDNVSNSVISDIFTFMEAVTYKENEAHKADPVADFFTEEYNSEEELPFLFRQSYKDYADTDRNCSYYEYSLKWLEAYNTAIQERRAHVQDPTEFVEVCPNCGREIDIFLPQNSHAIPFCPYCGQPDVLLCSECMEITNCNDKDPRAFCYNCKKNK